MPLTEQRFMRSEKAVREAGLLALIESLGYADALRFLVQLSVGQGDYLVWQDAVFGEAGVDDLYDQAETHWQTKKPDA